MMIAVDMREAKRRLSQLIKAIEEEGAVVILHRNGQPVADPRPWLRPRGAG
jgi:antitoxin (DNA-binding transcriptional repressor) of toxin-antitoxin stability system